jgi:hypothetical protein
MGNKWTDFVKEYAKKHNMSYGCALSDKKMKEEYHKKKGTKTTTKPKKKEKTEEESLDEVLEELGDFQDIADSLYMKKKAKKGRELTEDEELKIMEKASGMRFKWLRKLVKKHYKKGLRNKELLEAVRKEDRE